MFRRLGSWTAAPGRDDLGVQKAFGAKTDGWPLALVLRPRFPQNQVRERLDKALDVRRQGWIAHLTFAF